MSDDTHRKRPEPCRTFLPEAAEEFAALHALSALSQEEAAAYERHLADGCASCRAEVQANREMLADVARSLPPVEPPAALRARLLGRLRDEPGERSGAAAAAPPSAERVQVWKRWAASPRDPSSLHIVRAGEGEWEETECSGVRFKKLWVDLERSYVTMLVRMEPGAAYPSHRHAGAEECYVLEGDLRVAGEVLGPGDYQLAHEESRHGIQSTESGCLLLVVSSLDDELT